MNVFLLKLFQYNFNNCSGVTDIKQEPDTVKVHVVYCCLQFYLSIFILLFICRNHLGAEHDVNINFMLILLVE